MSTMEQKFDLILKKLDSLTGLEGKIDGIEGKIDTLEGRFDGLEGRFEGLEGRFDGLEGRFDDVEATLDRHGVAIVGLQESVSELSARTSSLEIKQDITFNRVDSIAKKMDIRNDEVSANHGNYVHLEQRVTNVEHAVFGKK